MVLQRYISHLILTYAAKYIRNIETHLNLGLWGGDITLNNLEARLDVLQHSLGIPAAFTLSRGFIKEFRIHIPWSAILTKPVEVTLTGVECVLHFNPHASDPKTATPPTTPRTQPAVAGTEMAEAESSGGWATDLILKILANLSITLHDLSIKYHESTHTTLCLRLPLFTLHSTDPSWRSREFMDLLGAWRLMHKVCRLEGCSVFLYGEREGGGDSLVRDDEVCILDGLTVSVRVKSYLAALGASVDTSTWSATSATVPSTPATLLPITPSSASSTSSSATSSASPAATPSPSSQALPRPLPPPCGPAISVDIHVQNSVTLHLSSDQFDRLYAMVKSKADFYATSAAAARVAQSIAAVPAAIAKGQTDNSNTAATQQHNQQATRTHKHKRPGRPTATSTLKPSQSTAATASATAGSVRDGSSKREHGERKEKEKGWMSWMWEFVAAEEEDDPDSGSSTATSSGSSSSSGSIVATGSATAVVVREKDERFDFQRVMGHLAPTEEILFCFHLSSISLHLKNDRTELVAATTVTSLALPSIDSDSPLSSTRLQSDGLFSALPPSPQSSVSGERVPDTNGRSVSASESGGSVSSSPWLSSVSAQAVLSSGVSVDRSTALTFARLEITEIGMILSQPLSLSKPSTTAQHSRKGSGSHLSTPPTPSSSSPSSASLNTPAVKPPTFCVNIESVTVSVKDSPAAAPRAVLRFGPDSASSLASFALLPATPDSGSSHPPPLTLNGSDGSAGVYRLHVSKSRGRHAPFQSTSCLHRSKYWERVQEAGDNQHLLYALSIFHTVKPAHATSADSSAPSPSASAAVLARSLPPQWVACFDVLVGPLSLGVDWSSSGTDRLIAQLLTFAKTVQETDEDGEGSPTAASMRVLSAGVHKLPSLPSSPALSSADSSRPSTPSESVSPTLCWLQLKCAVPGCDGYILGNPCPGHGEDGAVRCRKSVVRQPCRHFTAHVEVACLPY